MAVLEIKNLKSGEVHHIPASGATLGREGAKADIQIRDPGVSKRHARIYEKGGAWYLVDMGSSNGTFVEGTRLTGPVPLDAGAVFGMSRHKFEVVGVVGDGANGSNGAMIDDALYSDPDDDLAPLDPGLPELSPAGHEPPPMPPARTMPPLSAGAPSGAPTAVPETAPPQPGPPPLPPHASHSGPQDGAKKGVGDVLVAVPKAIAFYLVSVPLLALNPAGTVRKSIEEQKPPLNAAELIAYALPANLFAALLLFLANLVGQLVRGTVSVGDILPIGGLIGAVVGSVAVGLLWHPVLGWLIRVLKGSSDEKSRSSYFLLVQTARVLIAIPSAAAVLLALVNVPFLNLLPPVLTAVASLLTLLVTATWLKHFDVMKPVQTVVLVLGVLGALGSGWGVVPALLSSIDRVTSGGGASGDVEDLQAAAAQAAKKAEELQAELKAKLEAGASEDEIKALRERLDSVNAEAATAAASAASAVDNDPTRDVSDGQAPDSEGPAGTGAATASGPPPVTYAEFAKQLRKVEAVVGNDPTIIAKDKDALALYRRYHRARYEVEQRYEKLTAKDPALRLVNERLRDADVYQRTARVIDELYKKLTAK